MPPRRHYNQTFLNAILLLWIWSPREILSLDCYSCQGINCQRTTKVNETVTCPNRLDDCVTIFSGTTAKERGCYTTIPERYREKCDYGSNEECHKCSGNLCNNMGAESCIICSANKNEDAGCFNNPGAMEQSRCPLSVGVNAYCFVRTQNGVIERGCLLDLREQVKCLDDKHQCRLCLPASGIPCNDEIMPSLTGGSTQTTDYSLAIAVISSLVLSLWN